MFAKLIEESKEKGLFKKYPENHIISFFLDNKSVSVEENDNEYIEGIKYMYSTFAINFFKNIFYIQKNFDVEISEWIIKEYLACENDYTNEKFLFRYSNILIISGFICFSREKYEFDIQSMKEKTIFRLISETGSVVQIYPCTLNRGNTKELLKKFDAIELEVGLKKDDIIKVQNKAKQDEIFLFPSHIQEVVDNIVKASSLFVDEKSYNICLLHLLTDNIDGFNVYPIKGAMLNEYTGLFVNSKLYEEYGLDEQTIKNMSGILASQRDIYFFIYGDIRYLLNEKNYFYAINHFTNKKELDLYPFVKSDITQNIMGIYNVISSKINDKYNFYLSLILQNYNKSVSSIFTNNQVLFLKSFIRKNLKECPQLLKAFKVDVETAQKEIYKKYELMYSIIKDKYPSNHPFQREEFLYDAMSFSLAYCMYVIPIYLDNTVVINDFLHKKLVCSKKGLFDSKIFNESYSEFEIFFYLFVGIFCKSERYKEFCRLEYEPNGNLNKRFEYAFVFRDYKINVEVKALECAPEFSDNIDFKTMKHGTRFYKNYFHSYDEKEIIPEEVLQNAKKLKSNYRQVGKNIKKINEKCIEDKKVINLGFLMINYGTSREEYISYLMNSKQGYLKRNPLDKLDAVILFSMCMDTDLLMEEIIRQEHIFVFPNLRKNNVDLFADLRLNNYVCEEETNPYTVFFDNVYGEFVGIKENGMVTIQSQDISPKEWERAKNKMSHIEKYMRELLEFNR